MCDIPFDRSILQLSNLEESTELMIDQRSLVNPFKTNVVFFTKKYNLEAIESLRLKGREISFINLVKC
jgi:hypothetical protein